MTTVYSVRVNDVERAQLLSYRDQHQCTIQDVLHQGLLLLLEQQPDISKTTPTVCTMCARPIKVGDYAILKGGIPFDSVGCFAVWFGHTLTSVLIETLSVPDLGVDPVLLIKWHDILNIKEVGQLGRDHYLLNTKQHIFNIVARYDSGGKQPRQCSTCFMAFSRTEYQDGVLLVAAGNRNYHHLSCLLPHTGMLDTFRAAVAIAITQFRKDVAAFHTDKDVPTLEFDLNSITLEVV